MLEDIIGYEPVIDQEISDKDLILQFENQDELYDRKFLPAHYTASGFIMNEELTKVLFAYHNIYDSFAWSGGHNDGDQDFLRVAIKEAKEETGVENFTPLTDEIDALDVLHVKRHLKRGKFVSDHLHFNVTYILIADENEETRIKADENSAVKWISIDELDEYVSEKDMMVVYNKLIDRAKKYQKDRV